MLSFFRPSADIKGSCESEMISSLAFMSKYKQKSASAAGATALIGDFGADSQCTTTVFG